MSVYIWTYSVIGVLAAWGLACRNKEGFILGLVSATMMLIHGLVDEGARGLILLASGYLISNTFGLVVWSKHESKS